MLTSFKSSKKESLNEIDFRYLMISKIIFVLCGYFFFGKNNNFILLYGPAVIFSSYFAM